MLGKKLVIFVSSESMKEALRIASTVGAKERFTLTVAAKRADNKMMQKFFVRYNDTVSQALVSFNEDVTEQMAEQEMVPGRLLIKRDSDEKWQESGDGFEGLIEYDLPIEAAKTLQSMAELTRSYVISIQEDFFPFAPVAKEGRDFVKEGELYHYMDAQGKFIDRFATEEEAQHNLCHSSDGELYDNGESSRPGTDTERAVKEDKTGRKWILVQTTKKAEEDGKKDEDEELVETVTTSRRVYMGEDGRFSIRMNVKLEIESAKPRMSIVHSVLPEIKYSDIRGIGGVEKLRFNVNAGKLAAATRAISTPFISSDDSMQNFCILPEIREDKSCHLGIQTLHSSGFAVGDASVPIEAYSKNFVSLLPAIREKSLKLLPISRALIEMALSMVKAEDVISITMICKENTVVMIDLKAGNAMFTFSVNKFDARKLDMSRFDGFYDNYMYSIEFSDANSLAKVIKIASSVSLKTCVKIFATKDSVKIKMEGSETVYKVGEEVSAVELRDNAKKARFTIGPVFMNAILKNNISDGKLLIRSDEKGTLIAVGDGKEYRLFIAQVKEEK